MLRSPLLALGLCLLAPAVGGLSTTAHAQAPAAAPVTIEATLVRASRGDAAMDPALSSVARDLKALPFTTFEAVRTTTFKASPGTATSGDLGKGIAIQATVESVTDAGVSFTVQVTRDGKTVSSTKVQRPWGRAHVLSVGRDGGASLVVPIRALR